MPLRSNRACLRQRCPRATSSRRPRPPAPGACSRRLSQRAAVAESGASAPSSTSSLRCETRCSATPRSGDVSANVSSSARKRSRGARDAAVFWRAPAPCAQRPAHPLSATTFLAPRETRHRQNGEASPPHRAALVGTVRQQVETVEENCVRRRHCVTSCSASPNATAKRGEHRSAASILALTLQYGVAKNSIAEHPNIVESTGGGRPVHSIRSTSPSST